MQPSHHIGEWQGESSQRLEQWTHDKSRSSGEARHQNAHDTHRLPACIGKVGLEARRLGRARGPSRLGAVAPPLEHSTPVSALPPGDIGALPGRYSSTKVCGLSASARLDVECSRSTSHRFVFETGLSAHGQLLPR